MDQWIAITTNQSEFEKLKSQLQKNYVLLQKIQAHMVRQKTMIEKLQKNFEETKIKKPIIKQPAPFPLSILDLINLQNIENPNL